jgi:hypothetical protein
MNIQLVLCYVSSEFCILSLQAHNSKYIYSFLNILQKYALHSLNCILILLYCFPKFCVYLIWMLLIHVYELIIIIIIWDLITKTAIDLLLRVSTNISIYEMYISSWTKQCSDAVMSNNSIPGSYKQEEPLRRYFKQSHFFWNGIITIICEAEFYQSIRYILAVYHNKISIFVYINVIVILCT